MRYLLITVLLLFSSNCLASETSYSVTIKPRAGIVGTVSFNIHSDHSVTILVYESASQIKESPINMDTRVVAEVRQLIEDAMAELLSLKEYSSLSEYKQTSAISITQDKVTKSVSTKRYSEKLKEIIQIVNEYIPNKDIIHIEKR